MHLAKIGWIVCTVLVPLGALFVAAADYHGMICITLRGDEAIAGCARAIASGRYEGKGLADLYRSRGLAWGRKRDFDRAIADYDRAIQLDPKYAFAYNNRGEAWRNRGDLDRAIADFNEAIRLDPRYWFAYDNRGDARREKGDLDSAIADFSEAIRLSPPKFRDAFAYKSRGDAWRDKGVLDRAIADYDQAIRLDPNDAFVYNSRGNAWSDKANLACAIADFDQAIRLDPKDWRGYLNRGRANLYAGALPKAVADLKEASELNPKHAYAALWLDIANKRSNLASRLAEAVKQIDMTKWPAPIIRLYLGELTPEALLAAATDADVQTNEGQVCEANFFSGELALQQSNTDEAERLFHLAAADCPRNFVEYGGANAELKALRAIR
jgi:lipoprotein NlpI